MAQGGVPRFCGCQLVGCKTLQQMSSSGRANQREKQAQRKDNTDILSFDFLWVWVKLNDTLSCKKTTNYVFHEMEMLPLNDHDNAKQSLQDNITLLLAVSRMNEKYSAATVTPAV